MKKLITKSCKTCKYLRTFEDVQQKNSFHCIAWEYIYKGTTYMVRQNDMCEMYELLDAFAGAL